MFEKVKLKTYLLAVFSAIIVLGGSRVTLEDCETLYDKKNMCTIINDGRIINFVMEDVG